MYVSTFCNLCSARKQSGTHRREERKRRETLGHGCRGGSGVAPDNCSLLGSHLALPLVTCLKYSFTSFQSHFSSCCELPTLPVLASEIFQERPTCSKCCESCFPGSSQTLVFSKVKSVPWQSQMLTGWDCWQLLWLELPSRFWASRGGCRGDLFWGRFLINPYLLQPQRFINVKVLKGGCLGWPRGFCSWVQSRFSVSMDKNKIICRDNLSDFGVLPFCITVGQHWKDSWQINRVPPMLAHSTDIFLWGQGLPVQRAKVMWSIPEANCWKSTDFFLIFFILQ